MPEPDWKVELENWVAAWVGGSERTQRTALESIIWHMNDAYQRGLMAGRSQQGYATRRKRKEPQCPPPSATGATESAASAGEP